MPQIKYLSACRTQQLGYDKEIVDRQSKEYATP